MPKHWQGGSDLVGALKQAIVRSGLTLYQLAKRSGVSHGQLSRFMRDQRTLTLSSAAKVFEALGLEVIGPAAPIGPARGTDLPKRPRGKPSRDK